MASHWIPRAATPTAAGESWGMVLFGDTQIASHFFDFLAAQYPLHPESTFTEPAARRQRHRNA